MWTSKQEKNEEEKAGTAGFFLSVFNLMNAILGSGILGLSYAMAQLGILCFFIICGGVAALAFYAIVLMLNMCKKTGAKVHTLLYNVKTWRLGVRILVFPIYYGKFFERKIVNFI